MTIKEAIKFLKTYPAETPCAFSLWLPEDVQSVSNTPLSEDTIADVLGEVHDNHDANYGINWDVLRYVLNGKILPPEDEDDTE
jgi:hypothetical protein